VSGELKILDLGVWFDFLSGQPKCGEGGGLFIAPTKL
jgi:hypothetical protein